jgi:adenosylcobyric acid synthase
MRGDPSLFTEGMAEIVRRTGWAPLGLVPHLDAVARLPAEDALDLVDRKEGRRPDAPIRIAVPLLPRIANIDDLDPLAAEENVDLVLVRAGEALPAPCDLVVLPGSKATIADLAFLRAEGWDIDLLAHCRRGGRVLGLCGGYQILGKWIRDPSGIEGKPGAVAGLGLIDVETVLAPEKRLVEVEGTTADGMPFAGYEMHVGKTEGADTIRAVVRFRDGRCDGATSPDGRVLGTYVHGFFADDRQRAAWLARLRTGVSTTNAYAATVDACLDALAAHVERHVDVDRILSLAR